jgi:hypothetical protein
MFFHGYVLRGRPLCPRRNRDFGSDIATGFSAAIDENHRDSRQIEEQAM